MGFFAVFDRCDDHPSKGIGGMDDSVVSQINSYVYYCSFAVCIKYEISSFAFFIRYSS